jgi:hypothetical protein
MGELLMNTGKILIGIALVMLSVGLLVTPSTANGCDTFREVGSGSTLVFADYGIESGTLQLPFDPALYCATAGRGTDSESHHDIIVTNPQQLPLLYAPHPYESGRSCPDLQNITTPEWRVSYGRIRAHTPDTRNYL